MWKLKTTSQDGRVRSRILSRWEKTTAAIEKAIAKGWRVSVEPILYDLYVADEEGELTKVVSGLSPQNAARYAVQWAQMDRESGCLMWPHGLPMPDRFKTNPHHAMADRLPHNSEATSQMNERGASWITQTV